MTIEITALTEATLDGTGVFDVLMRANKAHLESEFTKNRIKGPEYSTVYLGSLTQVMQTALQFILSKEKANLEAQLLEQQILLAQVEVQKATATLAQIEAQTLLVNQQRTNLIAEALNIPKQGDVLVAQKNQVNQQTENLTAEGVNIPKQGLVLDAQKLNLSAEKLRIEAQTSQITAETYNIPKQGLLIDANKAQVTQQTLNLTAQKLQVEAQTDLVNQQQANAVVENTVLIAQECKLRAEYDLTMGNVLRAAQETTLLSQKVATERAQTTALGVDDNSVLGKQKLLYQAQTDGFKRDAEQKAAKLLVDSWNVRRTTDEGTVADSTNMLNDAAVGRAVTKVLAGVGA